ncbi:MAG: hypothetical protein AAF196_20980 [Planctomycetota bacterium]
MAKRYTIAVDFDGVLNSYESGWQGATVLPDPPVEGAIEWLHEMIQDFDIAIMSTRNWQEGGIEAMRAWLQEHTPAPLWYEGGGERGLEDIQFPTSKPPALIYLDDRAVRFEGPGTFPSKSDVHRLRPWNKSQKATKTDVIVERPSALPRPRPY